METATKTPACNTEQRTRQYANQLRRWAKLRDSHLLRLEKMAKSKRINCQEDSNYLKNYLEKRFPIHGEGDILLICSPHSFDSSLYAYFGRRRARLRGKPCIVSSVDDEGYDEYPRPEFILNVESGIYRRSISNYAICPNSPDYNPSDSLLPFIFIPNPKSRKDFYQVLPILTKKSNELEAMLENYYQTLRMSVSSRFKKKQT